MKIEPWRSEATFEILPRFAVEAWVIEEEWCLIISWGRWGVDFVFNR